MAVDIALDAFAHGRCVERRGDVRGGGLASGAGPAEADAGTAEADACGRECLDGPLPTASMPVLEGPVVGPFSQDALGLNLVLSPDGYRAARGCGCRESAAIGSAPLEWQGPGLYFEVLVLQTMDGWLGGLGIGVTHTRAVDLPRMPDKAWRVPDTFIAGYSGCAYLNGKEHGCHWQPEALRAGQRVGCLISRGGREDLIIFVDGTEVFRAAGPALHEFGLRRAPLYPIVDVFNATRAVELQPRAAAPRAQ
mmetsp:Transcript_77880/g.228337  ORF Transcript_77880/g.228337 Transcript_77880/m.228337 type:complete len:251 (+) Transcript_77880:3-755(+)